MNSSDYIKEKVKEWFKKGDSLAKEIIEFVKKRGAEQKWK